MRYCGKVCVLVMAAASLLARGQQVTRPEAHPGGVLLVVKDRSGLVTIDSPLYLASNHGGWNPADPSMRLSGRSDLRWQVHLPGPVGDPPLAFKFTRGSWETVEVAPDLQDIANRTLEPVPAGTLREGEPVVIELEIARFADERAGPAGQSNANDADRTRRITGRAVRVQVIGGAGAAAGSMRDVIVWLPPGYDDPANAERRYPVLYMQDGQNVFDFRPPTPGEWEADETATRLIGAREVEAVIIAAIPHSGANRRVEYLPTDGLGVRGQGDAYIDWLVREVIPRVERAVRADGVGERRGVGGSSLGGLLALRAAQRYPETFGRVLAESPSLAARGEDLGRQVLGELPGWPGRTWLAVGTAEAGSGEDRESASRDYAAAVVSLGEGLRERGTPVWCEVVGGAEHNEPAWAARLGDALRFLYPVITR